MKIKCLILFCLVFLFLVPNINAIGLGLSSTNTNFDFVANKEYTFSYALITYSEPTQDYTFSVEGDFNESISFEPEVLEDVPPSSNVPFKVKVNLPSEASPGFHSQKMCVVESDSSGGMMSVKTAACLILRFLSVYPDKYIKANLDVPNVNLGEELQIKVNIENFGEKNISNIYANIDILNENGKVDSIETNSESLGYRESKELVSVLDTSKYSAGEYYAVAKVFYDSNEKNINDTFKIGSLSVSILNYTRNLKIGKINEFDIEVESGWNTKIENVYGNVQLLDEGGNVLDSFKTVSESLNPWDSKVLKGYWNPSINSTGKYSAEIVVYYLGENTSESTVIQIVESTEYPMDAGINTTILVIITIIIIILSILIYWNHEKKH